MQNQNQNLFTELKSTFGNFIGKILKILQKTFQKLHGFFSKCSKWAHFQFGGSFYKYLQLQGAFFENFEFSAISGRSKVKIS